MPTDLHFVIAADHPSLAGHFPGCPIVPGVVVLEHAIALLLHDRPGQRVTALHEVKFLAPVLPGDEVTIDVTDAMPHRVTFVGRVGQRSVLRCRAQIDMAS